MTMGEWNFNTTDTTKWVDGQHIHITNPIVSNWPDTEVTGPDPGECVICRSVASNFFCELCRQAVLDLRKQVLQRMMQELVEMNE